MDKLPGPFEWFQGIKSWEWGPGGMPLSVWRHSLPLEWVIRGWSWVLVSVLWAVPASLMGWRVDHAILSANSSPSGGNINHSEAFKNASAHWIVPISWAQPHHGKALRVQPLHFALLDLLIERPGILSLEKWWFRGCSFLLRSGLQHAEPTLPVGGMGHISSDSTPPLLPRGTRAFPRGRQSSLQGKDNLWSITQRLPGQRLQREGMKLQLADTSGGSGGYKNPSSAPFTAAGCWANDPMAPGLSLPSYKWGWW